MKRSISLLFFLGTLSVLADGMITITQPHSGPVPAPYSFAPLEISYHHVNVTIDGQVASTSVDEEFYNPNPQRLEGTYLFPVPKGAQINKFTMEIGGRQVEAELLAADKARGIYEEIVRKTRDPALLEYADRDVFKVRVFPIEPHGGKRITLSYSEVLKSEAGLVRYSYPLNTEKFSATPVKSVSVTVDLNSASPLQTIYSPSHEVEITHHGANRATVGFEARDVRPDTDFTLYFAPQKDDLGINLLTAKTPGEDGYFLLLESPAMDAKESKVLPKDVVFVLDTSGSMAGAKIEQAKRALGFCVANLNDDDRFELIRFSTEVESLFNQLVPANRSNRDRANDFVKDLQAMGGTDIDSALRKALSLRTGNEGDRPYVVVFLTDGEPTVGETGEDPIVNNVKAASGGHARVFCFGIGLDVNTHLLDRIAEETRAANQYVLPDEDIEVKVSSFFAKIKEPVLANPTLEFTGGVEVSRLYPSPLPDLFKGEQLIVVGRYKGSGTAAITVEGAINGEKKKFTREMNFSADNHNDFIPRLWANRRVGYLLDQIRLHGESGELRDEVTALARKYGIVTPYTAYLIYEDETRRNLPIAIQTMPEFGRDKAVHSYAAGNWERFKFERAGTAAIAGANFDNALESLSTLGGINSRSAAEANRALGVASSPASASMPASPGSDANVRLAQYSAQSQGQFVAGRNAFQNGNQWIDPLVQTLPHARRVRIQFNSPEYFNFVANNRAALPWLALGQNVLFVLNDTVYEIHD